MDFPATPPSPAEAPAGLLQSLGIAKAEVLSNHAAQQDYFVPLDDPAALHALQPDFGALKRIGNCRGVIVTAPGDRTGIDFVSRFFAPAFGIDEDPVTGSAHCTLSPYWSGRLGRDDLVGYQASRRGGVVGTRLAGDRVQLTGRAVAVLRGSIGLPG